MLKRRSIISIAPALQRYLAAENIKYDVIRHEPTMSSMRTAEACQISEDCLAKGIVLRRDGDYLLAVLPASHHIRLSDLRNELGENVEMVKEAEVDQCSGITRMVQFRPSPNATDCLWS